MADLQRALSVASIGKDCDIVEVPFTEPLAPTLDDVVSDAAENIGKLGGLARESTQSAGEDTVGEPLRASMPPSHPGTGLYDPLACSRKPLVPVSLDQSRVGGNLHLHRLSMASGHSASTPAALLQLHEASVVYDDGTGP